MAYTVLPQTTDYITMLGPLGLTIGAAVVTLGSRGLASPFAAKGFFITAVFLLFGGSLWTVSLTNNGLLADPGVFFGAQWAVAAVLLGIMSRKAAVVFILAVSAVLTWGFLQSGVSFLQTVLYLSAIATPLTAGLLLARHYSSAPLPRQPQSRKVSGSEKRQTEAIIEAMSEGVITLNKEGAITLMNPAAEKISGWERADALNLNHKSVLRLVDKTFKELTDAMNPISESIRAGVPTDSRKFLLETKSDKRINLSIIITPTTDQGGGAIVVFRDITSEIAEESSQAEFISTASHEMRTPVASIEGYLGLALNPSTAQIDEKARSFIMKAHESAQHLGRLFQDLLDVTRADDGTLNSSPKTFEITSFVKDIVGGLRHQAEDKSLDLVFKPDDVGSSKLGTRRLDPSYYARVDRDHLREVVANLTENAIKYTQSGTISIDISGDNEHVVVSFADTGIGIPKEDQDHLFQKFYRVDNTDTREIGGTGLGLYLVRRLVESMNGRIWVESEKGTGSTFFVQLDRVDSMTAQQQIETEQAATPPPSKTPAAPQPDPTPPKQATQTPATPATTRSQPPQPRPAPPQPPTPAQPAPQAPQRAATQPQVTPAQAQPSVPMSAPPKPQMPAQNQAPSPASFRPGAQPTPQPQPQLQPVAPPNPAQPAYNRENTPISQIEQNPARYQGQSPTIPPRDNT